MADIAPKLVELSADKLRALHERLHKSEASPANLEVHHLAMNEMARRGMERPEVDVWDEYEIQVDFIKNADLIGLGSSLPEDMVQDVIKTTGLAVADVRVVLTTEGYEIRLDKPEEVIEKAEGYVAPKAVRAAARRALDWIDNGMAGDGFTSVGRVRAGQLASGESISLATLKRMKSFFSRHEVDKEALGFSQGEKGFPSAGRVAWDAWGGDAGFAWAESMVGQADKEVAKHNQGQHDQKTHGKWADGIAEEILNGGHPSIEPENVTAFLMKAAKRTDHPDLTELKVNGTLLFGDEGMGIARKDMPQIPGKRRPEFLADLAKEGVTVEKEKVDPKTLKPIQKEISSARSGAIYQKFRDEGQIPKDERILVSKDGYVIDGHHTWGAAVGFSFDNASAKLPIYRISLDAKEALSASLTWAKAQGLEGQAIDAPAKKSLTWTPLTKHGEHNQKTHGSWATGGINVPDLVADGPISSSRSADAVRLAKQVRKNAEQIEPVLTKLMVDLAEKNGGEFVQLHNRIKETDSLARKIDSEAESLYGGDREKAANNISDSVRYTLKVPEDTYTQNLSDTVNVLENAGFVVRAKNFWQTGDPYDGVNIKFRKQGGLEYELQLHTPSSHDVKSSKLTKIYQAYREETNDSVRQSHWNNMVDIARSIPKPANYAGLLGIGTLVMQQFETARQAGLLKSTLVDKLSQNERSL